MAHGIPARLTPAEGRKFGLTVGLAFLVLASIAWWRGHPTSATTLGALGGALVVAGLVLPGRLGPVYRGWMRLAGLISKVTTPIFMGVVFFVAIFPVGFLMRLFGKNPLRHKPVEGSYWQSRPSERGTMANQF